MTTAELLRAFLTWINEQADEERVFPMLALCIGERADCGGRHWRPYDFADEAGYPERDVQLAQRIEAFIESLTASE